MLFVILLLSVVSGREANAIDGLKYNKLIEQYYQSQSLTFLWLDSRGKPVRNTEILLGFLEDSWKHGLNPRNYHVDDLKNYLISKQNIAPRFFDQMISDAYLRYVQDMTGMRVSADLIEQDSRYWRTPYDVNWLLAQAQNTNNLEAFLSTLEPKGPLYKKMKEELVTLVTSEHPPQERLILTQTKLLRPGAVHQEFVPMLRRFLNIPAHDWQKNVYDDELVQAVIHFQQDNNLKADGIVGPQTLNLMNKTPRDKVHQIIANMERLRWLSPDKPEKYVLVNIPSATLWAIENGQIIHEMPVIVGRKKRPTASFISKITGVRYNPTWTVPKTIKKEDFLPMLQKDPYALVQKGIDIKGRTEEGGWVSIDPTLVDWSSMSEQGLKQYRMIQSPGPTNPLGTIRILMPNQYNIYLHDTSSPEYFRSSNRNVSSGCVRIKEPRKVADFILSSNSNWDPTFTDRMLARGKMADIAAENKIPVYLLYLTVWINEDGSLAYGPDSYDWDSLLVSVLYQQNKMPMMAFATKKNGTTLAYKN